MSWNINLMVKGDEVTVTSTSGTLPEGPVLLYGHHDSRGNGFGMRVDGASSSAHVPYPTTKLAEETK